MTTWTYEYAAVVAVHDGDTLTVSIDHGQDWHQTVALRLLGGNARELTAPGGPEARAHLAGLLPVGEPVRVLSVRWDKYGGRLDAIVVRQRDGIDVMRQMLTDGYAAAWDGTGARPDPPWPIPAPATAGRRGRRERRRRP